MKKTSYFRPNPFTVEQIKEARDRLCQHCIYWETHSCGDILPLTYKGENCPYYTLKLILLKG